MNITKLVLGACSTNVYIVSSNKKNAILIDPADNAAEIIKTIEENGLCLKYIFITHGHTDHILALKEVKKYFNVPVIISKIDAGRLEDEELINERPYVKIPYKAVKADILICEDDIVNLDELSFSFLGMPGHTDVQWQSLLMIIFSLVTPLCLKNMVKLLYLAEMRNYLFHQ